MRNKKKLIYLILFLILAFIFFPKDGGGVLCGPICPLTGLHYYQKTCIGVRVGVNYIDGYSDLCFGIPIGEKQCFGIPHESLPGAKDIKLDCNYPPYTNIVH